MPQPTARFPSRSGALVLLALVAAAVLMTATARSAAAGPGEGMTVTVGGTAAAPTLTLANTTGAECRVAEMTTGLVRLLVIEQDGELVTPTQAPSQVSDGLAQLAADRLTTLSPGQTVTLPLEISIVAGTEGLIVLDPQEGGSATVSAYPVDPTRALRLAVDYRAPVLPPGEVPLCSAAGDPDVAVLPAEGDAPASASEGNSSTGWWPLAAVGLAGLAVLLAAILLRRRRRRSGRGPGAGGGPGAGVGTDGTSGVGAAAMAIALLAGLVLPLAAAPRAQADYEPSASAAGPLADCMGRFRAPGGDPAGVLPVLDRTRVVVTGGESYTTYGGGTVFINWDYNDRHAYVGGGNAEPCSTLYHEMFHGSQLAQGKLNSGNCWAQGPYGTPYDTNIRVSEVEATRAQNLYRVSHGLPPRTTYGEDPLPLGECVPPPKDADDRGGLCRSMGAGCGVSNGDPHLTTFDGLRYDFQAAGEFVLAQDVRGGFAIQVRQEPIDGSTAAAVTTAAALDVGGTVVAFDKTGAILIDGSAIAAPSLASTGLALAGGGRLDVAAGRHGPVFTATWTDGSAVQVSAIGVYGLLLAVQPSPERQGQLRGLLGDFDGEPGNDLVERGGPALSTPPEFDALYPGFADSWRIAQSDSLLGYAPGTSTGTYTIRPFPTRSVSLADLPNPEAARAACIAAGVTDPQSIADCMLDVALTGRTDFARALSLTSPQSPTGAIAIDGAPVTVPVGGSEPALLRFRAAAGQSVYVEVTDSTLPDQCSGLDIRTLDGAQIAGGCLIGGAGSIDTVDLTAGGEYLLAIHPELGSGTLTVRLVGSTSNSGVLVLDGPAVTARVADPGGRAVLSVDAPPGTVVFVQATASGFPDQCGLIEILDPGGVSVNSGCVVGGAGYIDATRLSAGGTYSVVVDPDAAQTGELTLRILTVGNQTGSIALNGPPIVAEVSGPGGTASFTFDGRAGQVVSVVARGSTFPDQCSLLQILNERDIVIALGCAVGGSGSIDATALPEAGTYRLVVDPYATDTGRIEVRLEG